MSNYLMVIDFHEKFGVPIGRKGHLISAERQMLRARLMTEELAELIAAMQMKDYVNIAKQLTDLLYVVYGTGVEYGIPVGRVFEEVHRSNMTKTPAKDVGGKVQKGEFYKAPEIEKVIQYECEQNVSEESS